MQIFGVLLFLSFLQVNHKTDQMQFPRVKDAYDLKWNSMTAALSRLGIHAAAFEIYIQIFKEEKVLELWARNKNEPFVLVKKFQICATSGRPGPKRNQGDKQIPEGFYHISVFNPCSNYYLSLGINYPNAMDRIRSKGRDPGGDIYIHGGCATIGCIPITDDKIKELYVFVLEARNNGQSEIPVHIFPTKMDKVSYARICKEYAGDGELLGFWDSLRATYDYFEKNRKLFLLTEK